MISRNKLIFFIITCLVLWRLIVYIPLLQYEAKKSSQNDAVEIPSTRPADIETLHVEVYYETLCPDSRSFFIRQLLPTYDKGPNIFNISLVPYGKASTQKDEKGKYFFRCQHGPTECQGNKVHACAIKYVTSISSLLRYTTCMISDNSEPQEAGRKCAQNFNIDWEPIKKCSETDEGNELLAKHGDSTNRMNPPVSFIPTILVNKNLNGQPALLKDLFKELCLRFQHKPDVCH